MKKISGCPRAERRDTRGTVIMNIYDTLIWRDKDGKFVAGLAETWDARANR